MDIQGIVGEYMYGHTGDSGGSTCMDTQGVVGGVHVWTHRG